jgi:Mlc titration factor MtfA (ptsG expression regulator)
MLFSWLNRRRRRHLITRPFPDEWLDVLDRNVYHYAHLSEPARATLRDDLRILVAEKTWEGCGGLTMSDEIRVTIAAQAALLLGGFRDEYFDAVQSILVYPDAYIAPDATITRGGVVLEGDSAREGEAWHRGPVVLSWADAQAGGRGEVEGNLVLHEFAHQLDMRGGPADGIPPLATRTQHERWQRVMQAELRRLERDCRRGRRTLLDCYGATDMSELFAVATEYFFTAPRDLTRQHRELYTILADFYGQDPARWD